ncbi:MAG: alpha/beta hydrolase [Thiothrix sp.]|nr:alpha/beta hydrolase [Thiothrix sp.]
MKKNYGSPLRLLGIALLLSACGGGSDDSGNTNTATPARGQLQSASRLASFTRAELDFSAGDVALSQQQQQLLQYGVTLYKLVYVTQDQNGALVNASGLLVLPDRNPQLAGPLLSFQHGTIYHDAKAPSNDLTPSAPPLLFASLGYITLAPDYLGYGSSRGAPHPYLQKTPSAMVVIDLLRAAQTWLDNQGIRRNGQLFLTGYSQGGYVTMAAQQALEALNTADLQVTAAVPAAGPYDVGATLNALLALRASGTAAQRSLADTLAAALMGQVIPEDSDISFDNSIFSSYISHGAGGVAAQNVHDWKALAPVRLFHGRDDETVPFINGTHARDAMQARSSADVQLIECEAEPADHAQCIVPYALYTLDYLGGLAQGL